MGKLQDRLRGEDAAPDPDDTASWAAGLNADQPPPVEAGTEIARVDARSERALAVARDFVGMVEVGVFATQYPRHFDRVLELAELVGQAKEQLAPPNRELVDAGLRRKLADAAAAFAAED
jgi:hypothetical protein